VLLRGAELLVGLPDDVSPGVEGDDKGSREPERHATHGRMAGGGHGLPKISERMPYSRYPSMPCLPAVSGVVTHRVGGLWSFATPLNTPRRKPFSLEMNRLHCEDIVEATLVAAVAVAAASANVQFFLAIDWAD
jgi:hypothetical protein